MPSENFTGIAATPEQAKLIEKFAVAYNEALDKVQERILQWIFAMHVAGFAGALAYIGAGHSGAYIRLSTASFFDGFVGLLVYGAIMFYVVRSVQKDFSKQNADFLAGKIGWLPFLQHEAKRKNESHLAHVMAWVSTILGITGIGLLFAAICNG